MRDISGLVNITGRLRHRLLNNIVYKTGYKRCVLPKKKSSVSICSLLYTLTWIISICEYEYDRNLIEYLGCWAADTLRHPSDFIQHIFFKEIIYSHWILFMGLTADDTTFIQCHCCFCLAWWKLSCMGKIS